MEDSPFPSGGGRLSGDDMYSGPRPVANPVYAEKLLLTSKKKKKKKRNGESGSVKLILYFT